MVNHIMQSACSLVMMELLVCVWMCVCGGGGRNSVSTGQTDLCSD